MSTYLHLICVILLCMGEFVAAPRYYYEEESPEFWRNMGQRDLMEALRTKPNTNVAKNVIIFIGDGMGLSTVMASRVYKGQLEGGYGEDDELSFERFPYVSLIKTYSVDHQVPDSAATATAIFSGVKTNSQTLGVSAKARFADCNSIFNNEVSTVLEWAQDAGKDTGFVTTTRVTDATPAALYAHSPSRFWESDSDIPQSASMCKDIAKQLVQELPGKNLKVILGGGRKNFLPKTVLDATNKYGNRKDNVNLIHYWTHDKLMRNASARYVINKKELQTVYLDSTNYLLGLFDYGDMQFDLDRDNSTKGQPSLADMTRVAITMLQKSSNGFFLMVEGGKIDLAHHITSGKRALTETIALADAVQTAVDMTYTEDTLIIVMADHSHVFTINGYPLRGNPILGIASKSDVDGLPYTTLMYTNGPKPTQVEGNRRDLNKLQTDADSFIQDKLVPLKLETHAGEDVALYAVGPMAHLLQGVREQNFVAYVMAYASCIGTNKKHCLNRRTETVYSAFNYRAQGCCVLITLFAIIVTAVSRCGWNSLLGHFLRSRESRCGSNNLLVYFLRN